MLADFHLDWVFDLDHGAGTPEISVTDIYLDLGTFISDFLAPILEKIQDRVNEVGAFYTTLDIQAARAFLKKYDVQYIIVGQLERNIYPLIDGVPDGLSKFEQFDGTHWREVYHDADTTIYEVIQ